MITFIGFIFGISLSFISFRLSFKTETQDTIKRCVLLLFGGVVMPLYIIVISCNYSKYINTKDLEPEISIIEKGYN